MLKEETIENRFGFTGEQYDPVAGMYYLRARFYNPVIGRFIQEDTYYGDGLNLYTYCHNNPVRYVDPSGHASGFCNDKNECINYLMQNENLSESDAIKRYEQIRNQHLELTPNQVREVITGSNNGTTRLIAGTQGIVTGGDSTILGENIFRSMDNTPSGSKRSGYQAQHIIPHELDDHPILLKIGMDLDDASNGIFLRERDGNASAMSRHQGYHKQYTNVIREKLNALDVNLSVAELQREVYKLQQSSRKMMEQGTPIYNIDHLADPKLKKKKNEKNPKVIADIKRKRKIARKVNKALGTDSDSRMEDFIRRKLTEYGI